MPRLRTRTFILSTLFTPLLLTAADNKGQLAERTEADILKTVTLPEGYDATVFAPAPKGGYPTSVSAAIDGTIFVAIDENGSLGRDRNLTPGEKADPNRRPGNPGKVVRMRDTDGDGRADEFKTFCEVESPRGVIWDGPSGTAPGTLYVMHPPNLTAYTDTDGDGVADKQEDILTGLGFDLGFRGADHTTNGARLAIDGFIYIAVGDYGFINAKAKDGTTLTNRGGGVVRIRPDGTGFEIVSRGQRNIYDVAVSPTLDIFTRDNTNDGGGWNVRLSYVPPGAHMGYPYLFKNFPEDMYQPLFDYGGGSPCGSLWVDEPGLQNGLYTVEWGRNAIMYHTLKQKGAGYEVAASPQDTDPKLPGQKEWLKLTRPTDMDVDASGRIYITSWEGATFNYNGPYAGYVLRVVKKDAKPTPVPDLAKAAAGDLWKAVGSDSSALRLAAQREILRRSVKESGILEKRSTPAGDNLGGQVAALETWVQTLSAKHHDAPGERIRLSTLMGSVAANDRIDEAFIRFAGDNPGLFAEESLDHYLSSQNPRIRAAAVMALRRQHQASAAAAVLPLVADEDTTVSHLAVRALSEFKATPVLLGALDSSDAKLQPGALQALYGIYDPAVVEGLLSRLGTAKGELRRGILNALCRLANQDAPYEDPKVWWGTRPDTSGPVYQPIAWSETDKITAALRKALDSSDEEDGKFLVARMYQTKVAFPGLVELMLAKAGSDTPAKLTALEGMVRADNSLPPEGVAALQSIATSEQEAPELRVRALRVFQRCAENGSVFPGALAAFAPLAGHDIADGKIKGVFEDFTRGSVNGKWVGDYTKALAGDDVPKRFLAATVLVNLSTGKVGRDNEREAAKKAVEKGWAKPESAAALLTAIARTGNKQLADQVKAHLNDPNNAVAESALFAYQKLGLKNEGTPSKTIGEMKYDEVFAAVQKGGDANVGKDMYLRAGCIACHTVNADEPPKGPILSAVAKIYDRAALTESILKPNAKIAQGFESQWFKKKGGEQVEGFVTREGGDSVDVRNIAGQTVMIEKSDVAERGHRPQSMMPEGLLNAFTPAELANLLAWLESLKK